MRFNNRQKPRRTSDYVRGVNSPIPYMVRNASGDWTKDLPTFKDQREDGWDTDCCWLYAAVVDVVATQCNFLKRTGQFPAESLAWFEANGYIDANGLFSFSERFLAVKAKYPDGSPVRDGGNDQIQSPMLMNEYGLLPYVDFNADPRLTFASRAAFDAYFFDGAEVTAAMSAKALKCLEYLSILYEWIGKEGTMPPLQDIRAMQFQSPMQVGAPVPEQVGAWNAPVIKWDGSTVVAHSVGLMRVNADDTFGIADQYQPRLKTLSADYPIPMVSHIYVTPILRAPYVPPVAAEKYPDPKSFGAVMWAAVREFFVRIGF